MKGRCTRGSGPGGRESKGRRLYGEGHRGRCVRFRRHAGAAAAAAAGGAGVLIADSALPPPETRATSSTFLLPFKLFGVVY